MGFTPEQIKGRIKSVAKQNNADARTLMRIYMMERFLERLAQSEYRDNFIIKGGILVTAMIGVAHRSTMDIDTSMKNLNLSAEDALRVVNQVKDIDLDDGVSFDVKDVSNIMDEMEYPGIRVTMNANVGRLITPLKIDISTGDVITPRAIEFNYDLLLEDRSISLWSYNLETILAEKLQTVLARGILNTRMRDFYDIRMLLDTYEDKVNKAVLKDAFAATCKKRGTDHLQEQAEEIIKIIEADEQLQVLWRAYQKKYSYRCAIREIQTKLEVLDDEFSVENNRNPISFIKTRIKKPNSIYDKLQKMGYEFTTENIQTYLNDVAGVRIVCAFIDDIYMISDLITQQDDIKVIEIKDYIKNPKSNGYRSYHMIVEIPVFFAKGKTPMRVELQIRTNGMDFWATLEHQLRYKKGIEEMPGYDEISEELLHSARAIIEADNEMQRIKDKIGMFHEI